MLHAIANALLERETITGEDIDILMKGEKLPPFQINGQNAGEFHLEEEHPENNASGHDDKTPPAQTQTPQHEEKAANGASAPTGEGSDRGDK